MLNKNSPMKTLTEKQEIEFDNANQCHICEKPFTSLEIKVRINKKYLIIISDFQNIFSVEITLI